MEFGNNVMNSGDQSPERSIFKGESPTKSTDVDAAVGFPDASRGEARISRHANSSTGYF